MLSAREVVIFFFLVEVYYASMLDFLESDSCLSGDSFIGSDGYTVQTAVSTEDVNGMFEQGLPVRT